MSTPNMQSIADANEGFNTSQEQSAINAQIEMQSEIISGLTAQDMNATTSNIALASVPTSDPTAITVYFTKSANQSYYGTTSKSITWNTYFHNVIPCEWTVSYYGSYPAYLQAGAMASKMYAWYYILTPKWNFAPYYSNVKDNSEDQNFLYNKYSSLSSTYRTYIDDTMSYVANIAMLSNEREFFEVHYHATSGTQHSGQMSASGALSMAKNGSSMYQILSYYYDYSSYIGSTHYVVLYAWA